MPPVGREDYQSQHELIVRLLVGRVDDDTAQARAPAVYVPAIFVDNPWSKMLGRDLQGFDKRMANFLVSQGEVYARLLPDGRLAETRERGWPGPRCRTRTAHPLSDISGVSLVGEPGR